MEPSQKDRELTRQLTAWFLGPKAENAEVEEKMVLYILQDYFHWRRNYFPADEILITQSLRREALAWNDRLLQQLAEMLAGLRRHFPFHNPRYNAHMITDQTIPGVLGYLAGLLYNPNNVTPEAAPVTLRWELEVGADILRMLGFQPPPPEGAPPSKKEFGWAHVTSGGTVANLEAMWAARNIRYFPLAVHDVVKRHGIALSLRLPNSTTEAGVPMASLDPRACMGIKPNQAVYLYSRFADAVRHHFGLDRAEASRTATDLLSESRFSIPHHGTAACYNFAPPAIFVAGTRHYSLSKIADVLGIGRRNLVLVDVDSMFRVKPDDLRERMSQARSQGLFPLAAIAVAGTTEEGAVDPVHRLAALRDETGKIHGESFWLHVDAAWGGYLRSVFMATDGTPETTEPVNEFVSREITIRRNRYEKTLRLQWGYSEVTEAYLAFPHADSITVDPHKLGYVPYPCGVIAFRNDLVRQFVAEEAPYLSDSLHEEVVAHHHRAPGVVGPYILEGSKPGASVAACWLSHRMIAPDRTGYGEILRASLLGARELYERLLHWETSCQVNGEETLGRFVPFTGMAPDMNIVCFIATYKNGANLARTNALNRWVYQHFTIDVEHGDRHYSYAQPFFVAHTHCGLPDYPKSAMEDLFQRAGIDASDYATEGLFVLRSTVMSPFHVMAAETGHTQNLLAEFVEALAAKVEEGIQLLS